VRKGNGCALIFNSTRRASGKFWSPNHPGLYPRNCDCHYIFHGRDKEILSITFEFFDVEGFGHCDDGTQSDFLLFSNYQTHDRTNRRYCGHLRPLVPIVSESNYFRMNFKSNQIFDGRGFYAHYQFLQQQKWQITRVKTSSTVGHQMAPLVLVSFNLFIVSLHRPETTIRFA